MKIRAVMSVGAMFGGLATAQLPPPFTLTTACGGGGATFEQDVEVSPTGRFAADAKFVDTATAANLMFSHACFWRDTNAGATTRLRQFYYDPALPPMDQGGVTQMPLSSAHWEMHWPDVDNQTKLEARWIQSIVCRGPENVIITNVWTLTAQTNISLEFYAYADFDIGDHAANQTTPPARLDRQVVEQDPISPGADGSFMEFFGARSDGPALTPPSSSEVDFFPNTEVKLVGDEFAGLSNSGLPFPSDDYTGALGWDAALNPGESVTVVYTFGWNTLFCETANSVAHHPASSVFPSVTLDTGSTPLPGLDVVLDLDAQGAAPLATLMVAFSPTIDVTFTSCGHALYLNPFASVPVTLDVNGHSEFTLRGGGNPLFHCGWPIHFQLWVLQPMALCLPLEHSRRLTVTYGF